jgi:hypothetical protein
VPIALFCNVSRIVATAVAYEFTSHKAADFIFHDLSGWLMMPLAMVLLYAELRLLDVLLVEPDVSRPAIPVVQRGTGWPGALAGVPSAPPGRGHASELSR